MDSTTWVWDPKGFYYHAPSDTYALLDASGEWSYIPAKEFRGEMEEGEIEDDVGWGALMEDQPNVLDTKESAVEAVLRLVISVSEVLDNHHVAIIDAREGGVQIGRDRCERGAPARIRLKEMLVSKTHAVVYHDAAEGWCIVDTGSTHGTFAPDRLSEPKHASKPHRLKHLDKIRIGSTTFIAHIHPDWPCAGCQLSGDNEIRLEEGTNVEAEPVKPAAAIGSISREDRRKREIAALKDTYLSGPSTRPAEYTDRAAIRRRLHPDLPPSRSRSRSPSPARSAPSKPNFAANMMTAQGWAPGTGLGKERDGRVAPVDAAVRIERAGLGIAPKVAPPEEGDDWRKRAKQRRYDELRPNI